MSSIQLLYEALSHAGIPAPQKLVPNSSGFIRWGSDKRFWAIRCHDGWCFGNHARSIANGKAFPNKQYTAFELEQRKKAIYQAKQEAERIQEAEYKETANLADRIMQASKQIICANAFPYLERKKIPITLGFKAVTAEQLIEIGFDATACYSRKFAGNVTAGGFVVIPAYSCDEEIASIQLINDSGEKRFLPRGRTKGCYYSIGEFKQRIMLCEGLATSVSVHMATGELTMCCFSSCNLLRVAISLRSRFPHAEIILCADNDAFKERNAGLLAAVEAGATIGAAVVFPVFTVTDATKPTDFNDLHVLEGLGAVKDQISRAYGDKYGK